MCRLMSRRGSQRKPKRMRMVVTTSTTICVSARSGAENHKNVMHTHIPAPPSRVSAASRWYLACHAAATAHTAPSTHSKAKAGDSGSCTRSPMGRPRTHSGNTPASSAAQTSHIICQCRRSVPSARRPLRPARVMRASVPSKIRCPLMRRMTGGASTRPRARCRRSTKYSAMPPPSATRLIMNGVLNPCHTARL